MKLHTSPAPDITVSPDQHLKGIDIVEPDTDALERESQKPGTATGSGEESGVPASKVEVKDAYEEPEQQGSPAKIASSVAFYFVVSISLVFLNKYVMKGYNFPYPIFVTWYQQIVSLASLFVCSKLCSYLLPEKYAFVPPLEFDLGVAQQIFPLTVLFVCMLSFNNLCLRYVEVWFYQVARSLTILFTLCISYFYFGVSTSRRTICACAIVVFGFLLGSVGRGGGDSFSGQKGSSGYAKAAGIVFGLLSSVFVSLYGIYVKKKLAVVANNEWRLLNYNTAMSFVLIIPVIFLAGEGGVMKEGVIRSLRFWADMTFTGVFSFLICVAIFIQVKFTSPLTNNISGTAKACCQTVLAIVVWHSRVSFEGVLGIILVLGGSGWYSFIRYQEMMAKKMEIASASASIK